MTTSNLPSQNNITKNIAIMGATGSIGDSTLSVISQNADQYNVVGLTGFSRLDKLIELCQQFTPKHVCVPTDKADQFAQLLKDNNLTCQILIGEQGLIELATLPEVDIVVASIVGAAGLPSTLAAAQAGKTILLANKEALVMAGELMIDAVKKSGAKLLPIDSEHNAIFQCLPQTIQQNRAEIHANKHGVKKLWLTASGGPFLNKSFDDMQNATAAEAVKHPNWSMGQKISVDSATMMNKGLELIEASFLFDMPVADIEVAIHPQSIVHSMVEYVDGSFLAQLGSPDMRTPIAHALAYPDRIESGVERLDVFSLSNLSFIKPDLDKFKCLHLAYQAMAKGGYACIALNASNEVAVQAFLDGKIRLTDIAEINEAVLNDTTPMTIRSLEDILRADENARLLATYEVYLPKMGLICKTLEKQGKDDEFFREQLIHFLQKLTLTEDLTDFLSKQDLVFIKQCLVTASEPITNADELERLIELRCDVWKKHDKAQGKRRHFFRTLIYVMFNKKLEDFEVDLDELIDNVVMDLVKVDKKFSDDFMDSFLQEILFQHEQS